MRPSVVYQKTARLIIPPYLPLPSGFSGEGNFIDGPTYLLMMNPYNYVKTMWQAVTRGKIQLRSFILGMQQHPQTKHYPNPDYTIRIEWFTTDLEEVGLEGSIVPPTIPQKDLCSSSAAYVRRVYRKDFELGEYDMMVYH